MGFIGNRCCAKPLVRAHGLATTFGGPPTKKGNPFLGLPFLGIEN
jgi:hypothetical protein